MPSEPDPQPADPAAAPTPRGRNAPARVPTVAMHGMPLAGKIGLASVITVISGLTPVAARDAVLQMPPFTTGLVRFGTAAALLLATRMVWRRWDTAARKPITVRDWPLLLLTAALCVPINQACFLNGVQRANASHAGLMYGLCPVLVYLLTLGLGWARLSLRMAAAAVLAFGGAAAIAWHGLEVGQDLRFFGGDLLLLGAVASWAAYAVAAGRLAARFGALRSVSIVMALGALLYLPAYLVDGDRLHLAALTPRAIGGFAFITLATSFINYLLWSVALARIDVNRLTVVTNAAPIISVAASYFWHDEPLDAGLLAGAVLILTAITLANWEHVLALRYRRPG